MPELRPAYGAPDARDLILEAALKVFARSGFDGTTMRQIAGEAKVSAGLIHHHFKDKETLWNTVGARITQDFQDFLDPTMPSTPDGLDAQSVPRMVAAYMAYWKEHPAALRFQLWRVLGAPDAERKARSRQLNEAYVPLFAQAQRAGFVRDDIPAGLAMVTTGALIQFWLHSHLETADAIKAAKEDVLDDEAFLRYALSLILVPGGGGRK